VARGTPASWYTTIATDALLDSFPISRYDSSVAQVLKENGDYQKLQADWDAEGALPVSPEAARLAAWLVQMEALSAKHQGICWQAPVVGPNADGGINLEWEGDGRQLFVMDRPGQQVPIECVTEEPGVPPRRHTFESQPQLLNTKASRRRGTIPRTALLLESG
jgi:hypothetical protein